MDKMSVANCFHVRKKFSCRRETLQCSVQFEILLDIKMQKIVVIITMYVHMSLYTYSLLVLFLDLE